MVDRELEVEHRVVAGAGLDLADIATRLRALRSALDEHARLSAGAFGVIGMPVGLEYGHAVSTEIENLDRGVDQASGIGRLLHKTGVTYRDAEDATIRTLLDTMGRTKDSAGPLPPNPPITDDAFPKWGDQGRVVLTAIVGSGGAFMGSLLLYMPIDLCNAARLSALTLKFAEFAGRLCFATIIASMLWEFVVVPRDQVINNAISGWRAVASGAREIFGSGVPEVRAALKAAWRSPAAMSAADHEILEFITAGLQLADRAEKRAETLQRLTEDLNRIHEAAFWLFVAEIGSLLVANAAARIWPVFGIVREEAGMKFILKVVATITAISAVLGAATIALRDGFLSNRTEFTQTAFHPV